MPELASPDFRALFEAAPGLYLVLTPDLRIAAVSNAYLRATMTTRDSILGRGIFEVFPDNPDDPAATGVQNLRASLDRVLKTRQPDAMAVQKYDVRRPDTLGGAFEVRFWSPLNSPVCGPGGDLLYIIHRVEDVTDFIRLKQQGGEREKLARALEDRAVQMEAEIFERAQQVAEANRQLTQANDVLARLYAQIALLMERADDELRPDGAFGDDPFAARDSRAAEDMLSRIGQLIVEHKRLENELRQSQKMEAVGRLAGGVAHDFNNLLTVITGYASMLKTDLANDAIVAELDEIEKASVRGAALTNKLLAFSRKQVLLPRIVNPNRVIAGIEDMLRRLIGEDIQLETNLDETAGNVKADPHQLEQVIMNLVVNARDAMRNGGRISIRTFNTTLDSGFKSLPPGTYVVICVADTGHGMDSQTAARIFEPFFTTKEIGKGTGLGLSTVLGIVEQSGGTVTVDSAPGAGCAFSVYLPLADGAAVAERPQHPAWARASRTGTILLVEDEASLRQLIAKTLTAAGFRVLQASNGEEAIHVASSPGHIDLMLTDVVMPGISGHETVARLRAIRPDCAVLYVSGYDHQLIEGQTLDHITGFLPKPFTPRALLTSVSDLLPARSKDPT